jgi:hypothetical protein
LWIGNGGDMGRRTEVETEVIHALSHELIQRVQVVPDELFTIDTGEVLLAELGTRLVDAEPFELLCRVLRRGA